MGLLSGIPINRINVAVTISDMKKRELEFSYWLTLQNRVLDHWFVTFTMNHGKGKEYYQPTPRGTRIYKTVLELTKRNRLFKGPKFTAKELAEYKHQDRHSYMSAKNWLIPQRMLRPIFDNEKNIDRFELTEYAYEFFQTYVDTVTKGATYPGPRMLHRFAEATMSSIIILCFVIIKLLANRKTCISEPNPLTSN